MKAQKQKRRSPSDNEHLVLIAQTSGRCPSCATYLIYDKRGQKYRGYDVAHIYPLNATEEEERLLRGEERLSVDLNNLDNLLPLCKPCHKRFDHPRTAEEYRELVEFKKKCLREEVLNSLVDECSLDSYFHNLLKGVSLIDTEVALSTEPLDVSTVVDKLSGAQDRFMVTAIKNWSLEYYYPILDVIKRLEMEKPGIGEVILANVRNLYIKVKSESGCEEEIYETIVNFFCSKLQCKKNVAEVLSSFFVRNCEIFDVVSK